MSSEKNEKSRGKVNVGAVIILIISALVFIPVGGVSISYLLENRKASENAPVFGKYDGKKIAWEQGSDFQSLISNYASYYGRMGYDVNSNTQLRDYIFRQAYVQSIEQIAYTKKVNNSGWKVPAAAINRYLVNYYKDENGNFNERAYNMATANEVDQQRKDIEKSLIVDRYTDDVLGTSTEFNGKAVYGLKTSAKEIEFLSKMGTEKHSFSMASFNLADLPDSEVAAFASSHKELFTKYDLSDVSFSSKEEAQSVYKQLKNSEITFEDAVSTLSSKIYSDQLGKLTTAYNYNLANEVLSNASDVEVVAALEKDAISEPVETKMPYSSDSSWTIFRNDGAAKNADLSDAEVLKTVKSYMTSYEQGYIEDYFTAKANEIVNDVNVAGKSFESACADRNAAVTEIPAFAVNYGNSSFYDETPSIDGLSGVATNKNLLTTAFALEVGQTSEPVVAGSKVVVLNCTGIQSAEPADTASYEDTISSNNQLSAQNTLMDDPKLEDNYYATYFKYIGMAGAAN